MITGVSRQWAGTDRFVVEVDGKEIQALAYRDIVGELELGQRVLLNVSALQRGLGTGGVAFIVAPADQLPDDPAPIDGHIVKGRYLPQQLMVQAVEEQDSPHHDEFVDPADLQGVPVVVADLHSAVPAISCGAHLVDPDLSVAYVMTDGAALPAALSISLALMRERSMLVGSVTCGQSVGGDVEATTVANGIIAARRVLGADIVIVAQGPGNVGTGSTYGFSGLDTAWHLQQAALVGGRPIAAVRASSADKRPRHFGLSHHTLTVLGRATPIRVEVPIPSVEDRGADYGRAYAALHADVQQLAERHEVVPVEAAGLYDALADCPVQLRTMGRDLSQDPLSFMCAGAAGMWAAQVSRSR